MALYKKTSNGRPASTPDSTLTALASLSISPSSLSLPTQVQPKQNRRKLPKTEPVQFGRLHPELTMSLQTAYTIPNDILDPISGSFGSLESLITFATDDPNLPTSAIDFIPYQPPVQHSSQPEPQDISMTLADQPSASSNEASTSALQTPTEFMNELRLASFNANSELVASQQELTQTAATYKPYVERYDAWWNKQQAARMAESPNTPYIPSRPITVTKVYWFIEHERTRPKLKRNRQEYEEGTTLGKSAIITAISALENRRLNDEHLYPNDPEAKISLRTDNRIRTQGQAAKKNEVLRIAKAQLLKAAGSSAGTYTHEQLIKVSRFCFTHKDTHTGFASLVRDRAMLNLSTGTCFRGDNVREILLSDLFLKKVPFPELGEAATVTALMVLTDNAKHNANGRVDETGALRHRDVDLCPIGALALHLFCRLQVPSGSHEESPARPQFEPDFSDAAKAEGFGQYGKRQWYSLKLFPGSKGPTESMTYQNHHDRVKKLQAKNNINVTAVTHVARGYAATNSREHRASESDVKALGGWNVGESSYKACYERGVPVGAMLGAANFNAQRPGDYRLPRACLVPPAELLEGIFPWAEDELATLDTRTKANPNAHDLAAENFLKLLIYLRTVLLQDMALIHESCPTSYAFKKVWPFNTDLFQTFASTAPQHVSQAKDAARLALEDVPVHLSEGVCNSLASISVSQAEHASVATQRILGLERELAEIKNVLAESSYRGASKGRSGAKRARLSAPSQSPSPPPPTLPPLPPILSPSPAPTATSVASSSQPGNFTVNISFTGSPQHSSPVESLTSIHLPGGTSHLNPAAGAAAPSPLTSTNPPASFPAPPLSAGNPAYTKEQLDAWSKVTSRYTSAIIAVHKPWTWCDDECLWVPTYAPFTRNAAVRVDEVWQEFAHGINGRLGTQELISVWGVKWKKGLKKAEWTRRNKVVALIQQLISSRANWKPDIALQFLSERYSVYFKSGRKLADALSKKKIIAEEVVSEAKSWNP